MSPQILVDATLPFVFQRNAEGAKALARRAADLNPSYFFPVMADAWADLNAGQFRNALPALQKAKGMNAPRFVTAFLAFARGMAGDRGGAIAELADLKKMSSDGTVLPFNLALVKLGLGDHASGSGRAEARDVHPRVRGRISGIPLRVVGYSRCPVDRDRSIVYDSPCTEVHQKSGEQNKFRIRGRPKRDRPPQSARQRPPEQLERASVPLNSGIHGSCGRRRECRLVKMRVFIKSKEISMPVKSAIQSPDVAPTAIVGLDDVLCGGLTRNRLFLLEGVPGSGKTTLALQFLRAAVERGEPVLYVTLSETEEELRAVAHSHGWTLDGITMHELVPSEAALDPDEQNTMFHASEVELGVTMKAVLATVDRLNPTCVVFDSLSELRLLAGSPLRYRRQILALKQFFAGRNCTAMLLDDMTATDQDLQMQSIAHGVIRLEQLHPDYGSERRRLRVVKYRGTQFRGGYHDYVIERGGLRVFPRLVAAEHRRVASRHRLASDVGELDVLLGGGLEDGTSTLIVGAAGTGKSTLAAQFAAAAAGRAQRAALFLFDESPATLISRCDSLGMAFSAQVDAGNIRLQQVDPAELSPGEFTNRIREAVREHASIVVIDSLNGYLNAMPGERFLTIQLHELLMFLGQQGVATILIAAHHGMIGSQMNTPVDASYLADAVILLRYFEAAGEVRLAISVVKKRGSRHERTIREFRLDEGGIRVGQPLREFRGILTGVPVYEGTAKTVKDTELP